MASFGNIFRWRQLPPVGLTDEDDTSGAKAFGQKLDGSGDPPTGVGIDMSQLFSEQAKLRAEELEV